MVDLASGDSLLDQCAGSLDAEPLTPERRGHLVPDLDRALDGRGGVATGADEPPGGVVHEELHRPRAVGLGSVPQVRQREGDGFGELGPALRDGRTDQLGELRGVVGQRGEQGHGRRDEPDLRWR